MDTMNKEKSYRKHTGIINKVHNYDVRKITEIIDKPIIDTVITSPPYFNMKDYGYKNQIGFGQTYNEYLKDIKLVFEQVFRITKRTGSLWVVIDTFKQNDEVVPLPFDFSNKLKEIGWKLQDIIIWNKNKTVPWSRKGQTKNKFEFILFFTKGRDYKYYTDRVREYNTKFLKKWWVKYPERYNPKGKAPEEIWNYDIPTQGSWGNGYIKHFCPLPTDMIGTMINLTTNEGDIILDPFAGTGSVLVQASYMKRKYIGIELNSDYIKMFNKYYEQTKNEGRKNYLILKNGVYDQEKFSNTILDLRALKFARVLRNKLNNETRQLIKSIYVKRLHCTPKETHKLITVRYDILLKNQTNIKDMESAIRKIIDCPPLSNFGIEAEIKYFYQTSKIKSIYPNLLFRYTYNNTHKYEATQTFDGSIDKFSILSDINVNINEEHFG